MTQHKARRTNQIAFLQLPWAQEVPGSNPGAPTTSFLIGSTSESAAASQMRNERLFMAHGGLVGFLNVATWSKSISL